MHLQDYLRALTQRLWLLILGATLAMVGSYFALHFLVPWPRYQATATVLMSSNGSDWAALQMTEVLAPTYVEWAKHRPVLQSAINDLNLPLSFEELQEQIDVHAIKDTQFIEISATSTSPEKAAAIANEVAWQLTQHPLPRAQDADATQLSLQGNVRKLKRRIDTGEAELADLSNRLAAAESDTEIDTLTRRINVLQRNLDVWRTSYAELNTAYADYVDSFITVAEEAIPSSRPLKPWINVFVAGITGLVLAAGLAFILEHLDDTVKTITDVVEHLSVPALGVINPWTRPGRGLLQRPVRRYFAPKNGASKLCVADLSHITATYRRLSANIARAKKGPLQGIILVTSPTSEKSKTMAALGLAMSWTEIGRRTILVDASLRQPVLHTWLDLPNEIGLVSLLEGGRNNQDPDLGQLLHPIGQGDLRVVTSGPVNNVSPTLLLSPRLQDSLDELTAQADVVLLSGPPALSGPEAAILAANVNYILLVLEARKTRTEEAREAVEILTAADGTSIGVLLSGSKT